MDELQFRRVVNEDLAPLLQGTLSGERLPSTAREGLASYISLNRLAVKPTRDAGYRLAVDRSQSFATAERQLAGDFMDELGSVVALNAGEYQADLIRAIPRRVVAAHLEGGAVLSRALERLEEWSSQTYEGQRIIASVGFSPMDGDSGIPLADLWSQPFGPVMTNGFDTLIVVGADGEVVEFLQLSAGDTSSTAPYRLREVACWAEGSRISMVLNRHGEILVFKNQSLRFARRNGRWLHYVHEANIKRLSPPRDRVLREAMYESCLDVSFSRTGGCLGVVAAAHISDFEPLVASQDLLQVPTTYKTRLLSRAVGGSPFQQLDRRLRLELLSLDGAVILDHRGGVLAAGAIIEVPAGSDTGGGRTAAARKLSAVGVGVKISQDGTITAFRSDAQILKT